MMMMEITNLEIIEVYMLGNGFVIRWSANIGFGEITFYKVNDKWYADTEYMDKDFCRQVLDKFLETIEVR